MDIVNFFVELLRDPRGAIATWITTLGPIWVYAPLFLIIFCETGLVVMPFLPGDSLLFTAGIFAADGGGLNLYVLLGVVWAAAILGDTCNYFIGRELGHGLIKSGRVKALKPEYITRTHNFFEKHGGKALVLARFFPIIRTFAPFLAGLGKMRLPKFWKYNIFGGILWSTIFVLLGYFFGGIPFVQEHFTVIILAIVAISFLPAIIGTVSNKIKGEDANEANDENEAVSAEDIAKVISGEEDK